MASDPIDPQTQRHHVLPAAGLKARKRAQFAAAVKCITDLDDAGLRLVLGYIPAWVKFSEYERAR